MRFWGALLVSLLWAASPLWAAPARVIAGEHAGFTRVVIQFEAPVDWQLGRDPQGYRLRIKPKAPLYDLKTVFNLISKSRLTATDTDPATGELTLSVSCACYAMPYEERPGLVVIDLRDGVAPRGSSFELPLDQMAPVQTKQDTPKPSYDWTSLPLPVAPASWPTAPDLVQQRPPPYPNASALRLSLIEDLGRGASHGLVDLVVPTQPGKAPDGGNFVSGQIQIGPDPNLVTDQTAPAPLTAEGDKCAPDEALNIAVWGGLQPVAAQMGPQRQGMMGEFDTPEADAVTRAIRFQLYLGFGAEAHSLIRAFAPTAPDAILWRSLADILDVKADPSSAFAGMEHCGASAALWATLADPKATPKSPEAKAAVLRSFSALPPHLRRLLGPKLVNKVLTAGDLTLATALYQAVQRALGDESPEIVMMQAQMDRALGKPDTATVQISAFAQGPGSGSAEALVDLIEVQAPLGQRITFAQVQALEAFLSERRGGPDAPRFERALILAKAASGDFDGAFAAQNLAPDVATTLWRLLAQSSPNSAFLTHASLGPSDPAPSAAIAFAAQIAERMLRLGLSDQAGLWVAQGAQTPPDLAAHVKLAQGDAQAALDLLQSDNSTAAAQLKAQAFEVMRQGKEAARIYGLLGQTEDHWRVTRQAGDWPSLASHGPAGWKEVATLLADPAPDPQAGPLAVDKALVAHSAATRKAILALLDQTKAPVPLTQ